MFGIRNIRSENTISPAKQLKVYCRGGNQQDQSNLQQQAPYLRALANLDSIEWLGDTQAPLSATAVVGDMEVLVPIAGLVDIDQEIARLSKETAKLQADQSKIEGKLSNAAFTDRAPAEVVDKERQRLASITSQLGILNNQIDQFLSKPSLKQVEP